MCRPAQRRPMPCRLTITEKCRTNEQEPPRSRHGRRQPVVSPGRTTQAARPAFRMSREERTGGIEAAERWTSSTNCKAQSVVNLHGDDSAARSWTNRSQAVGRLQADNDLYMTGENG
jgi:hypothetical protein